MRKLMICLMALFFVVFCTVTVLAAQGGIPEKRYDTNDEDVVILIKSQEKTEEAAKEIQKKVRAKICYLDRMTKEEVEKSIGGASLILTGWEEGEEHFLSGINSYFDNGLNQQQKVSLFYLSETEQGEETLLYMEEKIESQFDKKTVPGLFLTWDEKNRETELSCMDGWLTTAFTY